MKTKPAVILVVVAAVVGLACSTGGNDRPNTGNNNDAATTAAGDTDEVVAQEPVAFGETLNVGDADITVSDLQRDVSTGNEYLVPDNGEFITIHIEIVVTGEEFTPSPYNWQITASDGTTYPSDPFAPGINGVLVYQDLVNGQKATGLVVFDVEPVPFQTGPVTISYDPVYSLHDDEVIAWVSE